MTVAQVLQQTAVAFWHEGMQSYLCASCKNFDRYRWFKYQPVPRDAADLIAKDCGKTHCDACGSQIAGQTEEK